MVLDIILGVILLIAFIIGYRRGLLRFAWGIIALVAAIVLTASLRPYAYDMFRSSVFANKAEEYIHSKVNDALISGAENEVTEQEEGVLSGIYTLPEKYSVPIEEKITDAGVAAADNVSAAVTESVMDIASVILLFLVIRLALAIIYAILNLAFKFPLLKQTNKLAGAIASIIITMAAVYAVFAVAAVTGTNIFENTTVCKFLYDNNILLTVMGI